MSVLKFWCRIRTAADWQVGIIIVPRVYLTTSAISEAQQNLQQRPAVFALVSMTDDAMNNDAIATVYILLQRCGPCHFLAMHT